MAKNNSENQQRIVIGRCEQCKIAFASINGCEAVNGLCVFCRETSETSKRFEKE